MDGLNPLTGRFVWRELLTRTVESSTDFLSALFRWRAVPDAGEASVGLWCGDRPVGRVRSPSEEDLVRPYWVSYVAVGELAAVSARAEANGGRVETDAGGGRGLGRSARLLDPLGAVLALLEVTPETTLQADGDRSQDFGWAELACREPGAHVSFYERVMEWDAERISLGDLELQMFLRGGLRVASAVADPELAGGAPTWLGYVWVPDAGACCRQATALGGTVHRPVVHLPGRGRFAAISDPTGARLALWQAEA